MEGARIGKIAIYFRSSYFSHPQDLKFVEKSL
jgi:hypothetical protein